MKILALITVLSISSACGMWLYPYVWTAGGLLVSAFVPFLSAMAQRRKGK